MGDDFIPVFFFLALFLLIPYSAAVDTISANQEIKDGNTIVSNDHMYELGFFSPGNSKNRYLGIWYKKISTGAVVWVANRETPITDTSGTFKINREGTPLILSGGNTVIWLSNSSVPVTNTNINQVAQLLNTGNLVVWDNNINNNNSTKRNLIWESFDYPGDTLLAGMKFGKDLVTGRETHLTSWKSPDDPSPGLYLHWVDTNGYPQLSARRGRVLVSRVGPWNGLGFHGLPTDIANPIYTVEFVVSQKEIYYKYELTGSVVHRLFLRWDGKTLQMIWIDRKQDWIVYADVAVDNCGLYAVCDPYGSCSVNKQPPCGCMEGFEPRSPQEWSAADWSGGCQRKKGLDCERGDGFRKISGVKFPDTRRSWYNISMSLGECEMVCKRNCSCTAYANLDIRNGGSGCLLWFDELLDIREFDTDHNLYIRMAASELAEGHMVSHSGLDKKKRVLTVVLPILSAVLLLFAVAYACRQKEIPKRKGSLLIHVNKIIEHIIL